MSSLLRRGAMVHLLPQRGKGTDCVGSLGMATLPCTFYPILLQCFLSLVEEDQETCKYLRQNCEPHNSNTKQDCRGVVCATMGIYDNRTMLASEKMLKKSSYLLAEQ